MISGVVYNRKSILFAYAGVENVGGMLCLCPSMAATLAVGSGQNRDKSFNTANILTAGYVLN